jgi:hypothetical protein
MYRKYLDWFLTFIVPWRCRFQAVRGHGIWSCFGGGDSVLSVSHMVDHRALLIQSCYLFLCAMALNLCFSPYRWAEESSRRIWHRHGRTRDRACSSGHSVSVQKIPEEKGWISVLVGELLHSPSEDPKFNHHLSGNWENSTLDKSHSYTTHTHCKPKMHVQKPIIFIPL